MKEKMTEGIATNKKFHGSFKNSIEASFEDDLLEDPDYYVMEALRYRDHSRLGGG